MYLNSVVFRDEQTFCDTQKKPGQITFNAKDHAETYTDVKDKASPNINVKDKAAPNINVKDKAAPNINVKDKPIPQKMSKTIALKNWGHLKLT